MKVDEKLKSSVTALLILLECTVPVCHAARKLEITPLLFNGRHYSVYPFRGREVVIPLDLQAELKSPISKSACDSLRSKITRLKTGLQSCVLNPDGHFCHLATRSLNDGRGLNDGSGDALWHLQKMNPVGDERNALRNAVAEQFQVSPQNVVLDVDFSFGKEPTIVFSEDSISSQLKSFRIAVSSTTAPQRFLGSTDTEDRLTRTSGLEVACDLLEGNALFKLDDNPEVLVNIDSNLHFAPNQAFKVSEFLKSKGPIQGKNQIEKAALLGARLAGGMSASRIEINDENVLALYRMLIDPSLQPIQYGNEADMMNQCFYPQVKIADTWFGKVEQQ